jgi:hypothetical protein
VVVGLGAISAGAEAEAVGAQGALGGSAVRQQPEGGAWQLEALRVPVADDHGLGGVCGVRCHVGSLLSTVARSPAGADEVDLASVGLRGRS